MEQKATLQNKHSLVAVMGALMVFLLMPPIVLGVPGHFPPAKFLLVFILLVNIDKTIVHKKSDIRLAIAMLLLFTYMVYKNIASTNLFGVLSTFLLPIMFWTRKDVILSIFQKFTDIYAYLILIPCFIYLLVMAGLPIPHSSMQSSADASSFIVYDVYAGVCAFSGTRFCGFFDEPGVVGTFSAVLLVANQFKLKPVVLGALLFSGIISFSLAFYAIIFLYIVFCSRSIKLIAGTVVVGGLIVYFFWDTFSLMILERIVFDEGALVTNRTTLDFDAWYQSFVGSDAFYWGLGNHKSIEYDEMGASYKHIIVDYGLVFFIIFILSLAIYAKTRIKSIFLWISYLIILIGVLYQRPFIELHSYLFILYAPIYAIAQFEYNVLKKKNESSSFNNLSQQKRKNSGVFGKLLLSK